MDRSIAIGLISFAVTASLLAIPTIANAQDVQHWDEPVTRAQMEARIAERFAAADTDGNGLLSREEAERYSAARRAERQSRRFARMDRDGDGEISIAERNAAHMRRLERRGVRRSDMIVENGNMRARLSELELAPLRHGTVRRQDSEGAGQQTSRVDQAWAAADSDGNGALNAAEFAALQDARHVYRAERRAMRFDRVDSDNDGALTLAEVSARSLARFDRADADSDGTVTPEERRAARHAMRAERRTERESSMQ
ncbi:hypothetical protein [Parasphingopyxis sp.]|uniref:EF-hand domain-containing protein n=1 Tax=Parasphingopyxis sp. TaxID=1920299 RepID=UPI002637FA1A|nr:hypothetical protein [Parasphingopyxis sp.]